jgi:methyl-accepting chemotaxis protein
MALIGNMKIATRLGLGFGLVLMLLLGVAVTGYWGVTSISMRTLQMLNVDSKMSDSFAITRAIALELRRYEKNMFIRIGSNDERSKQDFPNWNEQREQLEQRIAELEQLAVEQEDKVAIQKIKDGLGQYASGFKAVHAQIQQGKLRSAADADAALGRYRDTMNGVNKITADSASRWHKKMQDDKAIIAAASRRVIWVIGVLGLIAAVLGIGAALFIHASIMKPLRGMLRIFADISQGDLTKRLDVTSKDELGNMGISFNEFLGKLHTVISNVARNTVQLSTAANELYSSSEQLATGSEEVAAQAVTMAAASEEMAATSNEIAQNCVMAAQGSREANNKAETGAAVVQNTVQGMIRIAGKVKESARTVESLGVRSDQIGEIIGTIEDIADQTNLLALNAAIEAARAGEQGRGFAVVADEVRALAERTTKATKEIGKMIKAIQQETKGAVSAMENGVIEVEKGTAEAAESGKALQEILEQINAVGMQINQIATAAEEQTATTGEITNNIQQITEVVQESAKGAMQSVSAAEHLAKLAEQLKDAVTFFKTAGCELVILDLAANDHRLFVSKVKAAVKGEMRLGATEIPDHHTCRFGTWYDAEGQHLCGHLQSFKAINGPHERIHTLAKEALATANSGDRPRAEQLFREVEGLSVKIGGMLEDIRTECTQSKSVANVAGKAA